ARIVRERQRDRPRRRDRAVMRETRTLALELLDELRRDLAHALHVPTVARMQHAARNLVADLPAVRGHLRPLREHPLRDLELLEHDRRRTLLARELQRRLPAGERELAGNVLGEADGL